MFHKRMKLDNAYMRQIYQIYQKIINNGWMDTNFQRIYNQAEAQIALSVDFYLSLSYTKIVF